MDGVNKTLYIPLYGKALVSRKGIILCDLKAEEIWASEGFSLKGKSKSKWLAYFMGMRAAVFDRWVKVQMDADPNAIVLHIGCGLDNRIGRVGRSKTMWFDVDFPEVIEQRKYHYSESETYQMLGADVRDPEWLEGLSAECVIVVMEGVSMYLHPDELQKMLAQLHEHFGKVHLLMDCYTEFAAKASKFKNPINDVGVTEVYGLDDPKALERTGLRFVAEQDMTPTDLIAQLQGMERKVFQKLYAGRFARKLYRMYEFHGGNLLSNES